MKKVLIVLGIVSLTGCATTSDRDYAIYAETIKSMNRDIAMSEIACWQQQSDKTKMLCRKDPIVPEPPSKGFGIRIRGD